MINEFPYHFTTCKKLTINSLCLPVHYVNLYTMFTRTLCLPVHYVYLYIIFTCTLCLPVHYVYLYTMFTCKLWLPFKHGDLYNMVNCTMCLPAHAVLANSRSMRVLRPLFFKIRVKTTTLPQTINGKSVDRKATEGVWNSSQNLEQF